MIISPFSYYFNRIFPYVTPNQLTFMWGFLTLSSFLIIAIGGYWYMLLGILLYHLAMIGDYMDGEIARVTGVKTIGGTWLDKIIAYLSRGLMVLAVGIGLFRSSGNIFWLYLGIWTTMFLLYNNLNRLKVYETLVYLKKLNIAYDMEKQILKDGGLKFKKVGFLQKVKSYVVELLRPPNPFSFLFWAILFNVVQYYLILMAVISPYAFVKSFIGTYKQIGNIKE